MCSTPVSSSSRITPEKKNGISPVVSRSSTSECFTHAGISDISGKNAAGEPLRAGVLRVTRLPPVLRREQRRGLGCKLLYGDNKLHSQCSHEALAFRTKIKSKKSILSC